MTQNLKIEYYPRLENDQIVNGIQLINKNKDSWDEPFFADVKTHVDLEVTKEALIKYNLSDINNIIVLGTGGSIQTLSSLKHLSKKKIYENVLRRIYLGQSCP